MCICMCLCVCVCVYVYMFVCVCLYRREGEWRDLNFKYISTFNFIIYIYVHTIQMSSELLLHLTSHHYFHFPLFVSKIWILWNDAGCLSFNFQHSFAPLIFPPYPSFPLLVKYSIFYLIFFFLLFVKFMINSRIKRFF